MFSILMILLSEQCLIISCKLIVRPSDMSVISWTSLVTLACRTDLHEVDTNEPAYIIWTLKPVGATELSLIYHDKGKFDGQFEERFSVTRSEDGFMNLTIRNVSFQDAGTYGCVDDHGFGEEAYVELVVLGKGRT